MSHLYGYLIKELEAGRPAVLATVVQRRGSAPRGMGTKMVIRPDGEIQGTIGGGLLEGQTMEAAPKIFETGRARLIEFDLMGEGAEAAGMICGGAVDVFAELFSPEDNQALAWLKELDELSSRGEAALVALELDQNTARGRRIIWSPEEPPQDLPPELAGYGAGFKDGPAPRPRNLWPWFVEPVSASPTVYIFGGGHVSAQIAPLAALVDFKVVVIDDRAEFASTERFPMAEEVLSGTYDEVIAGLKLGPWAYVVIVTRGHRFDHRVLKQTLTAPTAYIGMIGSRRKRDAIYKAILEEGFTEEDLKRIHSPIGLDILAETPEEIAVSIVAELIKVRAEKTGLGKKTWHV